jgi:holo-[acyl-carrier protein] synthase
MMIYGIGTDIVEIERIGKMLNKHGAAFIQRVFTTTEIEQAEQRKDSAQFYAGRWAAKEALSKALGSGIGEQCSWQDIAIISLPTGAPQLKLTEKVLEATGLKSTDPIHLSISHEQHYACATVIIEKN